MARFGSYFIVALLATSMAATMHGQETTRAAAASPLQTTNATLRASLHRIAQGSPSWRGALASIAARAGRILVLTSDQVVVSATADASSIGAFDASVLAEAAPVPSADGRVDTVLVVVNLALLEAAHRQHQTLPVEFSSDLDRILVHEVYSHAMPYLLDGHMSGRCADPQPGERAIDACSIRRENVVRAELGLTRRTDYGLHDLHVMRLTRR